MTLDDARGRMEAVLALLRELVELESPTGDEARLVALADVLAREAEARGGRVERRKVPGTGHHLLARFDGADPGLEPLLVVGHMDTVHPVGTLEEMPFRVDGERLRGPGVYDMKGGLVTVLHGLDLLRAAGKEPPGEVLLLATADEEIGSPTSRSLVEELARAARGTLVLEPSVPGGGAKVRRKGVGLYGVEVRGRAAHAGIEPEAGASAVHELARQVAALTEVEDREVGTTVNVGVVSGGTKSNVVAARATAEVDVRFWTREEAERAHALVTGLEPVDARCTVEVTGGINRPALERTGGSARLYDAAREEAAELGFDLPEGSSGGASDGNFTAAVGCPTLDGLGPDGGGAHSADEHVLVEDLPRRVALLARLLGRL